MLKLNNKGQTLVLFVILIPVFILLLTLVYDVGNAIYEKNRLSNTSYVVISYGLDNIETISESELTNLIRKDIDNLSYIYVSIKDDTIEIELKKKIKGVIGKMFGFDLTEVDSYTKGKKENDKKKIERIK